MRFCRVTVAIALLLLAGLTNGCGSDPLGRQAISGSVKVDGAPLASGNLSLQPTEQQPTSGGAVISDGKYSIPREQGLVPGKYRVSINAASSSGPDLSETAPPGEPPPPPKELIPPEWNTASEHFIEVKKEGPFVFDFEVTTKGKKR
jgi:hypothetical protein